MSALCDTDDWVYFTGPAGRGKSWLADTFAAAFGPDEVARLHWHSYIRDLHKNIRLFGGVEDALQRLIGTSTLVCFDELDVDDPADGIFITKLMHAVDDRGIRMVITSNHPPSGLMPNPLFHSSFLPTIHFIESHCRIVQLDAGVDYRTTSAHASGFASGQWMLRAPGRPGGATVPVNVAGRMMPALRADTTCLAVTFADLCERPVGASDYLELASRFPRWTIIDIPDLAQAGREPAQRFLHLVDVLYDRHIPTTFIADVPLDRFGHTRPVPPATPRLLSRLSELQSTHTSLAE